MAFNPSYNILDKDTHNTLVEALKSGGIGYTEADGTVHKISGDYVEGGGSSLPEVSDADNGDVLTVVEGEWAKAAPSGGGGSSLNPDHWITITVDPLTYAFSTTDTYSDIVARIDGGEKVAMKLLAGEQEYLGTGYIEVYNEDNVEGAVSAGWTISAFSQDYETGKYEATLSWNGFIIWLNTDNSLTVFLPNLSVSDDDVAQIFPMG